ncbi:MAG: hypothetical protein RI911_355 [Candidatus Parcubacteria bacterium]|jgi:hypothetical protein
MKLFSIIGTLVAVILCVSAGYLFFASPVQTGAQQQEEVTDTAPSGERSIPYEVSKKPCELAGTWTLARDPNSSFTFQTANTYEEYYGGRLLGDGPCSRFAGDKVPHELKPQNLKINPSAEYLFIEGISEHRVYEIVSVQDTSIRLKDLSGKDVVLNKKVAAQPQ